MSIKERLKITLKEILPKPIINVETQERSVVPTQLVDFKLSKLKITSLDTRHTKDGSDVTCQTKCTACPTGGNYPKASCDICVTPEGCPNEPNPQPAAKRR